ncbi:hypothetical protein AAVH_14197 [Aphelenchoides avenae]|nr:hypothetical protein AAVH_31883 [Aphelenchus avenae]KAH7718322.1 hypothetical protein AAVH_14197 [Aphelenchus avenae]
MRTLVVLAVVCAVACGLVLPHKPVVQQKDAVAKPQEVAWPVASDGARFLCSPCKFLFQEVKKIVPEGAEFGKEKLEAAVNTVCTTKTAVNFLKHVCEEVADDAINDVYAWIVKEDSTINPERDCVFLHLC